MRFQNTKNPYELQGLWISDILDFLLHILDLGELVILSNPLGLKYKIANIKFKIPKDHASLNFTYANKR